ncbi:hypothetical protein FACS1894137_10260 [Spirochaetia bacterium]|nr:hypothetical protein FACS1894137_10260 [Spirochaetia bacterium]
MELVEHIKNETMEIIVPRRIREQIEALAAAHTGTEDQITDRLIHLGLEAYRAGEMDGGRMR